MVSGQGFAPPALVRFVTKKQMCNSLKTYWNLISKHFLICVGYKGCIYNLHVLTTVNTVCIYVEKENRVKKPYPCRVGSFMQKLSYKVLNFMAFAILFLDLMTG